MAEAICKELRDRKDYLSDDPQVSTIYFGGGTPSLLEDDELSMIMDTIRSNYAISDEPEITLEANPDDLTKKKLLSLREAGINRLSIGVQSFNDDELKFMNRAHDTDDALSCINKAADLGFRNISIDLIYGVPGKDPEAWKRNLEIAAELPVTHLSCYALTVERHTLLHNLVSSERVSLPDDEMVAEQFLYMNEYLTSRGFEHYEVSNFARPGFRSRHNSSYWNDVIYLGAGPAANSFDLRSRGSNIRSNKEYMKRVAAGAGYTETEVLSDSDRVNEYIMTRLRTKEGIDKEKLETLIPEEYRSQIETSLKAYLEAGLLSQINNHIHIPSEHWLMSDSVIRELFI